MNSKNYTPEQAEKEKEKVSKELGLPVVDVYRHGAKVLVDSVLALKKELCK